ncbi:MAG: hypothetical protein IBX55_23725 [Methyloprofundus sp.]|nr:hypothetical protein [Methyloprofundus sp.]
MNLINKEFRFRKTEKNKQRAGTTIKVDVPEFDWDEFIKTPLVKEFIEKQYYKVVDRLVKEVALKRNGTTFQDYSSFEPIIMRDLQLTQTQISEWLDSRDWDAPKFKDLAGAKKFLMEKLPCLSSQKGWELFPNGEDRHKIADKVLNWVVSDDEYIADFLIQKLCGAKLADEDINYLL